MSERFYVKHAWAILVVLGVLELQFGVQLAVAGPAAIDNANTEIQGVPWSELEASSTEAGLIDYVAKSWGVAETFVAITIVVVAAVPFRKGDKWSWYYCWLFPAFALTSVVRNSTAGVMSVVLIDSVAGILFAVPLLLTYRKFFPRLSHSPSE